MTIGDLVPADRALRRKTADAARAASAPPAGTGTGPATDATALSKADQVTIQSMVQALKGLDPSQAHRIEALRKQIADGTYTAEPDALAEAFISRDDR